MQDLKNYLETELKKLDRGIVATPETREELEQFMKASCGQGWALPMQLAMNFGYKIALENVQIDILK